MTGATGGLSTRVPALAGKLPVAPKKRAGQREIEATDREIDRLVYELYELSDKEIAIVEEATSRP